MGPARIPQIKIGSCEKWIADSNPPTARGMATGGNERMFAKAAMIAVNVIAFVLFIRCKPQVFCVTKRLIGNTLYKSFLPISIIQVIICL